MAAFSEQATANGHRRTVAGPPCERRNLGYHSRAMCAEPSPAPPGVTWLPDPGPGLGIAPAGRTSAQLAIHLPDVNLVTFYRYVSISNVLHT